MDLGLNGKIAIVTGGAMGIGKGIVSCLAREGATVVIADLNQDAAEKTAQGNRSGCRRHEAGRDEKSGN
jgi:NAD(P)-dependent dehydrogenase (short-subunit alcohol dehydrogenase family)